MSWEITRELVAELVRRHTAQGNTRIMGISYRQAYHMFRRWRNPIYAARQQKALVALGKALAAIEDKPIHKMIIGGEI